MNWVVWEKDQENILQWADAFLIAYQDGVWKLDEKLTSMVNCSLVVLNAEYKNAIVNNSYLPQNFSNWCCDARLWAHLGDVTGEPKDSDWKRFDDDIKNFPGVPHITLRKAFGSTYDPGLLKQNVAPNVAEAINRGATLDVGTLLQTAWDKTESHAKTTADERTLEVLFPLYLLLTHPDQKGIETAVQSILDAACEAAQASPSSDQTLVSALIRLARARKGDEDFQGATEAFCRQFHYQSELVTHRRSLDLSQS